MKRQIAILFGVPLVLLALYDCGVVAVCDGSYRLTVDIDPEISADIANIRYIGYHSTEMGDALQANIDGNLLEVNQPEELSDSFKVSVGTTLRYTTFGYDWMDVQQYSEMIVVLFRDDGTRSVHRLEVPHRDITRRVVVSEENQVPES